MLSEGQRHQQTVTLDDGKVTQFVSLTGDCAAVHTDGDTARAMGYEDRIVHGLLVASHFSGVLGQHLPGQDYVIHSLNFGFRQPVYVGDTVDLVATVDSVNEALGAVQVKLSVRRDGAEVMTGTARCVRRATGGDQ